MGYVRSHLSHSTRLGDKRVHDIANATFKNVQPLVGTQSWLNHRAKNISDQFVSWEKKLGCRKGDRVNFVGHGLDIVVKSAARTEQRNRGLCHNSF